MATKRIGLSKKTRFEVFKRDGFKCAYCGAHPPGSLLHVDHIIPVKDGGTNREENLITACEACNQGKGANSLSSVPESLAHKAARTAEMESQIRGYAKVMQARRDRMEEETWQVLDALEPGIKTTSRDQFSSVRGFIEKLGYFEVLEAADIALAAPISRSYTFKYFCGVCWNKLRRVQKENA